MGGEYFGRNEGIEVASKYIRSVTKILKATSGRLFGRVTAGAGPAEEITPADARTLLSVYSTSEVDSIIGGIEGLTSADIDTLAEINGILTDADLASISYVDSGLSGKQDTLVSGTSIKTLNSTSLLGSGDIVVSASPGGSSGQVQYNNAGAFGGMTAVVYSGSGTLLTVTSQAAANIPLCVKAAASQSGNLSEWRNSSNSLLVSFNSGGGVGIGTTSSVLKLIVAGGASMFSDSFAVGIQGNNSCTMQSAALLAWVSGSSANSVSYDTGFRRNSAGVVEICNGTAGTFRDLIVRNLRMSAPTLVPASASATGSEGQMAWDANYIYVCTATNTWKRVAIATW